MKEIILDFKKDKQAVDYSWEQPNTPWLCVPEVKTLEEYDAKLMLEVPKKRVYINVWDGVSLAYQGFEYFLSWRFGLRKYQSMLENNKEFFWDLVTDLKRNIKNKHHQKIRLTVDETQLGATKID